MTRLQGELGASGGGALGGIGPTGARGQLDSWLQDASASMAATMDGRRGGGGGGMLFGGRPTGSGGGGAAGDDGYNEEMGLGPVSTSSVSLELKRKVTDLVRALRPVPGLCVGVGDPAVGLYL